MKIKKEWIAAALLLLLITIPYLVGIRNSMGDFRFGGFFINPLDGNSYLAKMYQGWEGNWTFTLPYTAEPGYGTFLFLFYLLLGHVARWMGLSLILVFHLARVVCAVLMIYALWKFFSRMFPEEPYRTAAFTLVLLGSGLGWIIFPLSQQLTPDLWIAEAYPILSAFSNPHFSLAIAIILFLFLAFETSHVLKVGLFILLLSLGLSIIQPFGVVIVGITYSSLVVWNWLTRRRMQWRSLFWLGLGGMPMLVYQYVLVQVHPELAGWNAQNLTPSPGIFLFIAGFSPALLLAIAGTWSIIKNRDIDKVILLLWACIGIVLLYTPFPLQRRMILGLFIPICGLAVEGIKFLTENKPRRFSWVHTLTLGLSIPTFLLVLVSGIIAASQHNPAIFLSRDEVDAYSWINASTPQNAVILASADEGLYIPAYTGRRVIYGHPYETVDAEANRQWVESAYSSSSITINDLAGRNISYIFWGPRERALGNGSGFSKLPVAFQNKSVIIYSMQPGLGS